MRRHAPQPSVKNWRTEWCRGWDVNRASRGQVESNSRGEAEVGIEPTNAAFAEPCLTTWLPRRRSGYKIVEFDWGASTLRKVGLRCYLAAAVAGIGRTMEVKGGT